MKHAWSELETSVGCGGKPGPRGPPRPPQEAGPGRMLREAQTAFEGALPIHLLGPVPTSPVQGGPSWGRREKGAGREGASVGCGASGGLSPTVPQPGDPRLLCLARALWDPPGDLQGLLQSRSLAGCVTLKPDSRTVLWRASCPWRMRRLGPRSGKTSNHRLLFSLNPGGQRPGSRCGQGGGRAPPGSSRVVPLCMSVSRCPLLVMTPVTRDQGHPGDPVFPPATLERSQLRMRPHPGVLGVGAPA